MSLSARALITFPAAPLSRLFAIWPSRKHIPHLVDYKDEKHFIRTVRRDHDCCCVAIKLPPIDILRRVTRGDPVICELQWGPRHSSHDVFLVGRSKNTTECVSP